MRVAVRTGLVCLAVAMMIGSAAAQQPNPQGRARQTRVKEASTAIVNINTATSAQLQTLPGVGEKTAERILEYRQKNGSFKKIEELMNVKGIGEKSFLKMKDRLTVGTGSAAKPAAPTSD
jgi:competence protein ComEA